MASEWFRPAFIRMKTPILGQSIPSADRPIDLATHDTNESEEISARFRTTSRVTSYMPFRPSTPLVPTSDSFPNIRNPETVYYKPSGDQMAEMLKVVMMTQNMMDPVPIQYNSCILHVLEVYQDVSLQLNKKDQAIEELKVSHTKDIKDFEDLVVRWEMKEADYKAELRKLEVLLSKTAGGLETVSMARSNSAIHGSRRAAETISLGLDSIKERNAARNRMEKEQTEPAIASTWSLTRGRNQSGQVLHTEDRNNVLTTSRILFSQPANPNERVYHTPHTNSRIRAHLKGNAPKYEATAYQKAESQIPLAYGPALALTKAQLEALEQQQTEQEMGVNFESSISGGESSSQSVYSRLGVAFDLHEKPLPDIPGGISGSHRSNCGASDTVSGEHLGVACPGHETPHQTRFSFQPGDDAGILAQSTSDDRAQRVPVECHMRQRDPEDLASKGQPTSNEEACHGPAESSRKITAAVSPHLITNQSESSSHHPRTLQECDMVVRGDSSSSTITAVRIKSDRSAKNAHNNIQSGRPKYDRNSGSSEAVTAAKCALASSQRNALGDWMTSLGSQDEGSRGVRSQVDGEKGTSRSKGSDSNASK